MRRKFEDLLSFTILLPERPVPELVWYIRLNFFRWNYIKTHVYEKKSLTNEELKDDICHVIVDVFSALFQQEIVNAVTRIESYTSVSKADIICLMLNCIYKWNSLLHVHTNCSKSVFEWSHIVKLNQAF